MDYEFLIHPRAKKALDAAPADVKARIRAKIEEMVTNEFRDLTDYDVKKLQGTENDIYRTRIGGWRVIFALRTTDDTIQAGIVDGDKRSGSYRNIETADERADDF
jgi:mRNA-degrading endonuclease RelE of RelBE toxin-antitoxin system